jgi:hypothetical protein
MNFEKNAETVQSKFGTKLASIKYIELNELV